MTYETGIELLAKKLHYNDRLTKYNIVPEANDIRHAQATGIAIFMGELFSRNPYDIMFDARVAQRDLQVS